jgi:hypothetical protein
MAIPILQHGVKQRKSPAQRPATTIIVFFSVLAALIFWVGLRFYNFPLFALTAALAGVVGSWLAFQVGLGKNTRAELLAAGKN